MSAGLRINHDLKPAITSEEFDEVVKDVTENRLSELRSQVGIKEHFEPKMEDVMNSHLLSVSETIESINKNMPTRLSGSMTKIMTELQEATKAMRNNIGVSRSIFLAERSRLELIRDKSKVELHKAIGAIELINSLIEKIPNIQEREHGTR